MIAMPMPLKSTVIAVAVVMVQGTLSVAKDASEAMILVKDGQPKATIVLAERPTRAASDAARELQYHIAHMTNARLPITHAKDSVEGPLIWVGESAGTRTVGLTNESFEDQEYAIVFSPDAIFLVGQDELVYDNDTPGSFEARGTLNAVYDFLERFCNVRWFYPGRFGTDIPKRKTLAVSGRNIRRKPFFAYREVTTDRFADRHAWSYTMWRRQTAGFYAFMKHLFPDAYKNGEDQNFWLLQNRIKPACRRFLLRQRNGGVLVRANHSLHDFYTRFWGPSDDKKENAGFIEHRPEWFAQTGNTQGRPNQLCYTNEEVIEQVAADARTYFEGKNVSGNPMKAFRWGRNNYAVVPNDAGGFCQCAKCRALILKEDDPRVQEDQSLYTYGRNSDLVFHFVNEVAKRVYKTHPDKTVSALAYSNYTLPPSFELAPNVAVHYCWTANRFPVFSEGHKRQREIFEQWAARRKDNTLYLWLYYTFPRELANNNNYHCWPGFFAHAIGEQFKLFHEANVDGIFHCGYGENVENYVTFKLMDDPTRAVDALLEEYFRRMYGPAAAPMRAIYDIIENAYQNPENYKDIRKIVSPKASWEGLGTDARMTRIQEHMDRAKTVATSDLYRTRVALFETGIWDYMKAGKATYAERMATPIPEFTIPRVAGAQGKVDAINWDKALTIGPWYKRGSVEAVGANLTGKLAHDGEFLYLELVDPRHPDKLQNFKMVYPYDEWEIYFAEARALPFRQYAFNSEETHNVLSHGEVNFRQNVVMPELFDYVVECTTDSDRGWVARVAVPLEDLIPHGVEPGDTFYMNIVRVASPQVAESNDLEVGSLVPFCSVKDTDRLAEVTLAK
ncbi:MAG: DUF4838 domain-containing protein [Candidatus Pacebacteria bacterium]|nr:DUF4838 domain-containing protein [Candidatus Paceibacterota bacterium]